MKAAVILLLTATALFGIYLFLIGTKSGRRGEMMEFTERYVAHRGLFNNADIPENSLSAFRQAVENGYGIELDVQLTRDNKLVVFHDETLKRMCGDERRLFELSYDEISKLKLGSADEKIPLFSEVLSLVDGKVPLIVEIKPEGRSIENVSLTVEMLSGYKGKYCMESFSPLVVRWLKKNRPWIIRGQLSENFLKKHGKHKIKRFVLTNLLLDFLTRPDFIAMNHRDTDAFSYTLIRKIFRPVNVAWTVKNEAELEIAKKNYDVIIFDSFIPDN